MSRKSKEYFKVFVDVYYNTAARGEKPRYQSIASAQVVNILAYSQKQANYLVHYVNGFDIMRERFPKAGLEEQWRIKFVDCSAYFKPDWR